MLDQNLCENLTIMSQQIRPVKRKEKILRSERRCSQNEVLFESLLYKKSFIWLNQYRIFNSFKDSHYEYFKQNTRHFMFFCVMKWCSYFTESGHILYFQPDVKAYEYHLISALCEWTVAISLGLYILTFTYDFKNLRLKVEFYDQVEITSGKKSRSDRYQV